MSLSILGGGNVNIWSYSVMVITRGFDSRDLGSIPSKT